MENFFYETFIAILAFWLVLVVGFVIFICRMKMRRDDDTNKSTSCAPPSLHSGPKRVIQIYYIGNGDSSTTAADYCSADILSKVLERLEDHPPSYEEISSSGSTNNTRVGAHSSIVMPMTQTLRPSEHSDHQSLSIVDNNAVLVVSSGAEQRNNADVRNSIATETHIH